MQWGSSIIMPRAKRKAEESGSAPLQFVTTTSTHLPTTNTAQIRALVRANATKYQWRHSRSSLRSKSASKDRDAVEPPPDHRRDGSLPVGSPKPHLAGPAVVSSLNSKPHPWPLHQRHSSQEARESIEWLNDALSLCSAAGENALGLEDDAAEAEVDFYTEAAQSLALSQEIQPFQLLSTSFSPTNADRMMRFSEFGISFKSEFSCTSKAA